MTITLYDCATAPSPRRARLLLAEKGVTHETVQVDLRSGAQFDEAFRRINPQCTVPALLGRSPLEKAQIASWNWRIEFEGLVAIAEALRNASPGMVNRALPGPRDYAQIPELAQRGLLRVQDFFATLDARLEGREFIAADGFSIADITAVVAVDFARVVKVKAGEQHPHLLRWRARMAERPSMAL